MKKIMLVLLALLVLPSIALAAKSATGEKIDTALENEIHARIEGDEALQYQIDNLQLGASGGGLKLFDADDQFLGSIIDLTGGADYLGLRVYHPDFGGLIQFSQSQTPDGIIVYWGPGTKLFSNDDCTGLTYADTINEYNGAIKFLKHFEASNEYFIITGGPFLIPAGDIKSRTWNNGTGDVICEPYNQTNDMYLYEYNIVEPPFNIPVATPLRIE